MLFLEALYSELGKDKKLRIPKEKTVAFYVFNTNIGRALQLPTLKYGPESDPDWDVLDSIFLYQASIIQVITSLETFYQDILRTIAKNVKISEVDAVILSRFIKENRLINEFIRALEKRRL